MLPVVSADSEVVGFISSEVFGMVEAVSECGIDDAVHMHTVVSWEPHWDIWLELAPQEHALVPRVPWRGCWLCPSL